jgi:hypothetical protein
LKLPQVLCKECCRVGAALVQSYREKSRTAFDELKTVLTEATVLVLPTAEDPYILDTDALDTAISAKLL